VAGPASSTACRRLEHPRPRTAVAGAAAVNGGLQLRVPTKLGFKNPKHIGEIEVGNDHNGGYWETYGYNWFSGL